jgi:glycogen operon protein
MDEGHWDEETAKALMVFLNGEAIERGRRGEDYTDDSFLVLLNAHHEPVEFTMPDDKWGDEWLAAIDTSVEHIAEAGDPVKPHETVTVHARSVVVLQRGS